MKMPPALAKLFHGTALAATASTQPAPAASHDDDENQDEGTGGTTASAGVTDGDAARIRANAEAAVTQAVTDERNRFVAVLTHETGEGDAKASILSQPLRAEAAMQLLADTDLDSAKIIATVSKPAFAGSNAAAPGRDANAIAAETARERLRGSEHRPDTGASGAGSDGTGSGGADPKAAVRDRVKETRQRRNAATQARMGQRGGATA